MGTYILLLLIAVAFVVVIRLMHGDTDRDRIRRYVKAGGGKLIDAKWTPFGPGWVGKSKDRIYQVRYVDKAGIEHHAYCKTSGWSGVYLTEDVAEQGANVGEAQRSLEEENRRLREELERLKRQQA